MPRIFVCTHSTRTKIYCLLTSSVSKNLGILRQELKATVGSTKLDTLLEMLVPRVLLRYWWGRHTQLYLGIGSMRPVNNRDAEIPFISNHNGQEDGTVEDDVVQRKKKLRKQDGV